MSFIKIYNLALHPNMYALFFVKIKFTPVSTDLTSFKIYATEEKLIPLAAAIFSVLSIRIFSLSFREPFRLHYL
jgi:hypothetical protein